MNIFSGLMQDSQEHQRLEILKKKLKTAEILGVKHCVKCGFCCHTRTCIPTPIELKKIAKFLNLTPKELIKKYYAIDREWLGKIYYVKPLGKNIKGLAGKFIPSKKTFNEGACIFLDKDNLCKIYPVRPATAKATKCWIEEERKERSVTDSAIKKWDRNQLKKKFRIDGEKEEEKCE